MCTCLTLYYVSYMPIEYEATLKCEILSPNQLYLPGILEVTVRYLLQTVMMLSQLSAVTSSVTTWSKKPLTDFFFLLQQQQKTKQHLCVRTIIYKAEPVLAHSL